MTRFYLIRHGQKTTPDPLLTGRRPGVDLSPQGRAQAQAIAARLGREPIGHVASSPLERAQQTASPLARARGLEVEVSPLFHETDLGEWTGKTVDALRGDPAFERYNRFRTAARIPGGETMLDMQHRFVTGMLALRERFPDGQVAIVSHGDPIRAAVLYFSGSPIDFWHRFQIGIASITTIDLSDTDVQIVRLNETVA